MINVAEHRIAATSGPAVLCFTEELLRNAFFFIKQFRNKLEGISTLPDDPIYMIKKEKLQRLGQHFDDDCSALFGAVEPNQQQFDEGKDLFERYLLFIFSSFLVLFYSLRLLYKVRILGKISFWMRFLSFSII